MIAMPTTLTTKIKCVFLSVALLVLANMNTSAASDRYTQQSYKKSKVSSHESNYRNDKNQNRYKQSKQRSATKKVQYAQNSKRSRSDVMNEVKQRYNAKVLKISFNEKTGVYNVRMLMPSGKVRSVKVNAK